MKETEIAMQLEVLATPKPGLVDRNNSGSHQDMDLNSFLQSAQVLSPWFGKFMEIAEGSASDLVLPSLRQIGQEAEQAMYQVTGGVNTHKGLIFSLGLVSACLVRLELKLRRIPDFKDVPELQALICLNTRNLTKELKKEATNQATNQATKTISIEARSQEFPLQTFENDAPSHGERVYRTHGLKGIRQEAEDGFPAVFKVGLPCYAKYLKQYPEGDLALVLTLLELILVTEDTNLVKRGGPKGLGFMRSHAWQILKGAFDLSEAELGQELKAFDKTAIERNLSPGGAADNLALTIFLYRVLHF